MHLFSLMGTVLTKVIMRTPAPSWMVMADEDGSMALAFTGTDSTAVHSHSLLTGLLWMLHNRNVDMQQAVCLQPMQPEMHYRVEDVGAALREAVCGRPNYNTQSCATLCNSI